MSSLTSSSNHSWTYTTISVIAGFGAGYLIGLISTRFMQLRNRPRQRQRMPIRDRQTQGDDSSLIEAVSALSVEVGRLRVAMEIKESRGRRQMKTVDSYSDFVSAQEDSINSDEDEFFDITTKR